MRARAERARVRLASMCVCVSEARPAVLCNLELWENKRTRFDNDRHIGEPDRRATNYVRQIPRYRYHCDQTAKFLYEPTSRMVYAGGGSVCP